MRPEERKALIARLSSPEEEDRRLAMEALKDSVTEADLDWLTRPLSDESWRVRKEGIEGLSRLSPSPGLVAALIPLMDPAKELTLRNSVVEVLERLGHEAAPFIVDHLDIDQTDVRKFLVDILGNIAHPQTVPALLELLADPEDNIKAAAAEALAAIGDPSVCDGLLKGMEGADDWVVYSILGSLAQLRCREALPVFFRYLENQLLSKPALAGIGAMGRIGDGIKLMEALPAMAKGPAKSAFLASGSIYRRHLAASGMDEAWEVREAVHGAASAEVIQSLRTQLEMSDDLENRKDIIAVLGMDGSQRSLEAILALVEEESLTWDVDAALLTLGKGDPSLIENLLQHHDPLVRQRGITALASLGSVESVDGLYSMLADGSGHVRKDAALALARLGDGASVPRLLPLLEDEYSDVAQAAAQALVQLGQGNPGGLAEMIQPLLETAAPALFSLLIMILAQVRAPHWEELCLGAARSTEPGVRATAVNCLKSSSNTLATATIIHSLADEDPRVRVQAAVTLEELKHPEAMEPLKAAIHDQDPWVRSSAISALSAQPAALPEDLNEILQDKDLMMQTSALEALGRMAAAGREGALDMLAQRYASGALEVRRSICSLLGKVKAAGAFELLEKALADEDPGIRVFAVHALAQRGEERVPQMLREAEGKDSDKQVREAARAALEGRK